MYFGDRGFHQRISHIDWAGWDNEQLQVQGHYDIHDALFSILTSALNCAGALLILEPQLEKEKKNVLFIVLSEVVFVMWIGSVWPGDTVTFSRNPVGVFVL